MSISSYSSRRQFVFLNPVWDTQKIHKGIDSLKNNMVRNQKHFLLFKLCGIKESYDLFGLPQIVVKWYKAHKRKKKGSEIATVLFFPVGLFGPDLNIHWIIALV